MRYPPEIIEKIKRLREENFTLNEIMEETGLSKTTIHHHIRKIAVSDELRAKILARSIAKIKAWAGSRRGKSFKTYAHWEPTEWSPKLVNLVAHFIFDGELKKTAVVYNNRSIALIDNVASLMDELIGTADYKEYIDKNGVTRIGYFHVEIANFIKQKAAELFGYIADAPDEEKLAFLKAFFDDEGCVSFNVEQQWRRLVRGYQHSVPVLELVKKLLTDFGIYSRMQPKFYEICISRKNDIIRFRDLINFSEGVRVNGKRSNSVWKKSLEKRDILERLINSYQK